VLFKQPLPFQDRRYTRNGITPISECLVSGMEKSCRAKTSAGKPSALLVRVDVTCTCTRTVCTCTACTLHNVRDSTMASIISTVRAEPRNSGCTSTRGSMESLVTISRELPADRTRTRRNGNKDKDLDGRERNKEKRKEMKTCQRRAK